MDIAGPIVEANFLHLVVPRVCLIIGVEGKIRLHKAIGVACYSVVPQRPRALRDRCIVRCDGAALAHSDGLHGMK